MTASIWWAFQCGAFHSLGEREDWDAAADRADVALPGWHWIMSQAELVELHGQLTAQLYGLAPVGAQQLGLLARRAVAALQANEPGDLAARRAYTSARAELENFIRRNVRKS